MALAYAGKYAESQALAEECLAIYKGLGVRDSYGLVWLGWIEVHRGLYQKARAHLQAALDMARDTNGLFDQGAAQFELGLVAVCAGALSKAAQLITESIAAYEAVDFHDWVMYARCALVYARCGLDDPDEARHQLLLALRWAVERGSFHVRTQALPAAAFLLLDEGETERAVEIYELACSLPIVANFRWTQDVVARPIASAAAALPSEVVEAALERGRARDIQATLKELIEELREEV